MKGCEICDKMKKKGLCKKQECVEISSKQGQKLARQAKVKTVPQCVTVKNGKAKKCNTKPFIKKFLK